MKAYYITNCVNSTGDAINAMVDKAREITYKTFIKHVDWREVSQMLGYDLHYKREMLLKNDYAPSYYKSVFEGNPCYYISWSAIEYIFIY